MESYLPAVPNFHIIPASNPEVEYIVLCKAGPPGVYTFQATATQPVLVNTTTGVHNLTSNTYSITVAPGSVVDGTTIPGGCLRYTTGSAHNHNALAGGMVDASVTIVETGIPSGIVFQKVEVYQKTSIGGVAQPIVMTSSTTNSATGRLGGDGNTPRTLWGASMIFYNTVAVQDLNISKTATGTYDRTTTWALTKTVTPTSHSGTAGQNAGSSTWTVTATPTVLANNYRVAGDITITNPNGFAVDVSVADALNDGTSGSVTCPVTAGPTGTVPANGSLVCSYTAAPSNAAATLNTATVTVTSPGTVQGGMATAPVSFTANNLGDSSVLLQDPRFSHSQTISSSTTVNFPETFPCPSTPSLYVNGRYVRTETNTATLTGPNTNLTRTANVTITCVLNEVGETATGAGFPWLATNGAPNNWFMYTPWVTTNGYAGISTGANLIAGKNYVAGTITGTRGTTTSITITLNPGFRFDSGSDNVKIHPMSCTTGQAYVQPGKFSVKKTASQGVTSFTVTGLANTACYGIHVSVLRTQS